jgi:hypothetical protein
MYTTDTLIYGVGRCGVVLIMCVQLPVAHKAVAVSSLITVVHLCVVNIVYFVRARRTTETLR